MDVSLFPDRPILMVDDEKDFLNSANILLRMNGINNVLTCNDADKVMSLLKVNNCSMVFLDLIMPAIPGPDLLKEIITEYPDMIVVVLTGEVRLEKAVECIKSGAYDYLIKPIDKNKMLTIIRNIIKLNEIKNENKLLKDELISENNYVDNEFNSMITNNQKMHSIFHYAKAIAKTNLPVLITGETGTGKELLAQAIHKLSNLDGEFVAVNIAGLDDAILMDTLFGHKKGSFTSSIEDRKGLIDKAKKGTLFLDEIGDLNINSQLKLLRVLQERKYYPIGSDKEEFTDTRFIFATNQDIDKLLNENKIRRDFYYRLQSHRIHLPPLRERLDDIPLLTEYFLDKARKNLNKKIPSYSNTLINLLKTYNFFGNIRELEGIINDLSSQYNDADESQALKILEEKLNLKFTGKQENTDTLESIINQKSGSFYSLKEIEKIWINEALKKVNGNQTTAAKLLGMTRRALNNRLKRDKKK